MAQDSSPASRPATPRWEFPPEIPTSDWFEYCPPTDPWRMFEALNNFIYALELGKFLTWEAVVCEEQGLPLTPRQQEALDELLNFDDESEDEQILYINEIPRPSQPWYAILNTIAPHLLLEPFRTFDIHDEVIHTGWRDLMAALEKYGSDLSLPPGVESLRDVVPADLRHKLWLQSCFDALSGLGQEKELTLQEPEQLYRIEEFIDLLQEHKASVAHLGLTLDSLLTRVILPDRDRPIFLQLMQEQLGLKSTDEPLAGRLDLLPPKPERSSDSPRHPEAKHAGWAEPPVNPASPPPQHPAIAPAKYAPPVSNLLTLGYPSEGLEERDYSRDGIGAEHITDLIRLLQDEELAEAEWDPDTDEESPVVYAQVHAWRALGQLRAEAAIEPLLDLLEKQDDDDWEDWVTEEVPRILGMIGPAAIPATAARLDRCKQGMWEPISFSNALTEIAQNHPEVRGQVIRELCRVLEAAASNKPGVNGAVISDLLDLRAVEAWPVVEKAFATRNVDASIAGNAAKVKYEFGLGPKPPDNRPSLVHGPVSGSNPKQRAEERARQRKAEKKNKKKKR